MANVLKAKTEVATAMKLVKDHCMCARLEETNQHYIVIYPPGFQLDGMRVSKGMGKAAALNLAAVKMEQHWKESFA